MLAVLVALLLLSILASGFFLQARDAGTLSAIATSQSVAVTNAEMGMQEAIRRVRSAQIDTTLVGICTAGEADTHTCAAGLSSGRITGPNANPLTGGGLLYEFFIFRRAEVDLNVLAPGTARFVIRAIGYYGRNIDDGALVSSELEAEVEMGQGNRTACVGSYECI